MITLWYQLYSGTVILALSYKDLYIIAEEFDTKFSLSKWLCYVAKNANRPVCISRFLVRKTTDVLDNVQQNNNEVHDATNEEIENKD